MIELEMIDNYGKIKCFTYDNMFDLKADMTSLKNNKPEMEDTVTRFSFGNFISTQKMTGKELFNWVAISGSRE